MKSFLTIFAILSIAWSATANDGSIDQRVVRAVEEATDFRNGDDGARGKDIDPRFLKNTFQLLLRGAKGGDVSGWGKIKLVSANCPMDNGRVCAVMISFNDDKNLLIYSFVRTLQGRKLVAPVVTVTSSSSRAKGRGF